MRTACLLVSFVWLWGCVDTSSPRQSPSTAVDELAAWDEPKGGTKPPPAPPSAGSGVAAAGRAAPPVVAAGSGGRAASPPSAAGSGGRAGTPAEPPPPMVTTAAPSAPSAPGAVVITELMVDPKGVNDAVGEWFELHNPGDTELELMGCSIDDGSKTALPLGQSVRIAPAGYIAIGRQEHPGFTPTATLSFSLTNSADTLALRCAGVEIDRVSYDKAAGFALVAGASLALDPGQLDSLANDAASSWCPSTESYGSELGSPGRPNAPCDAAADVDAGEPET